jgi:hypothetical protein
MKKQLARPQHTMCYLQGDPYKLLVGFGAIDVHPSWAPAIVRVTEDLQRFGVVEPTKEAFMARFGEILDAWLPRYREEMGLE